MDISILLALQDFRNGIGSVFTDFMLKISYIGEMEIVLVIMALIYWCASKKYGTYFLMGWSANRVVNGLLKVTVCAYRPWVRDVRVVPNQEAMAAATGYSFPSGHSMNGASLYGGGAIRKELPRFLRGVLAIIFCPHCIQQDLSGSSYATGYPGRLGSRIACNVVYIQADRVGGSQT